MSPEYCRPPSPMTGTPAGRQASEASWIAVTCGTPTPATTRVVQIEPGPTPTLTASAPASTNACAPARVATLPPITWTWRVAGSLLSRGPCRAAAGRGRGRCRRRGRRRRPRPAWSRAPRRRRSSRSPHRRAAGRRRPWRRRGNCSDFTKSLTVMSPASRPSSSTSGSRSSLCWRSSRRRVLAARCPTWPVISGIGVMTSPTSVVPHSATGVKRRSRLVMMPSRPPSSSTTGRPETR